MEKHAKILFSEEIFNNEHLQDYIKHSSGNIATIYANDILQVIVKEVKKEKRTLDKVRMIAGDISKELKKQKVAQGNVNESALENAFSPFNKKELMIAFVEGWYLGAYEFDTYKSKKSQQPAKLVFNNEADVVTEVEIGKIRAAATAFSRDLMNDVPSTLNPETFPEILKEEYKNMDIEVVVHDKAALIEMEMNGILAVNRGSKFNPAFIELHYKGDESKPLIALVGKGVTFDTGGISLKSGRDLSDMRMDMGGAAAVAGAIKLLAESKANVNVVGLIQTVENIPDQHSILPGDIITYKNGHTVQVGNTDAEGRLILADGLIRAGELKAEYIVDIATLTGAIAFALGPKLGGIFGEEKLTEVMKRIGDNNGDFVWPMPLVEEYDETLKSNYADFSNISSQSSAGSITAALFLRRFVPDHAKWVHVDMAGVMESKSIGYYGASATGFGARLLADYAVEVSQN